MKIVVGSKDRCHASSSTQHRRNVLLINGATLRKAERLIESCEHAIPMGRKYPSMRFSTALRGRMIGPRTIFLRFR